MYNSVQANSRARTSSGGGGDASMSDVLLRKCWAIHWMSRMYHFRRDELSKYAHDLVKSLRDEALVAFKREFGYKVSIRHTDAFVAFEVLEERDAGDVNIEPLKQLPGMQQAGPGASAAAGSRVRAPTAESTASARSSVSGFGFTGGAKSPVHGVGYDPRRRVDESKDAGESARQRRGGFVLYFPAEDEDEQTQQRMPMLQRKMKETQYVVLLRGNEDLLGWACAWLQTRFQCIVSEQRISISPVNLKWLARNWIVDSLLKEEKSIASQDQDSGKEWTPELYGENEATGSRGLRLMWSNRENEAAAAAQVPKPRREEHGAPVYAHSTVGDAEAALRASQAGKQCVRCYPRYDVKVLDSDMHHLKKLANLQYLHYLQNSSR